MGAHRKERKVRKEFLFLSFAFFALFVVFYIAHLPGKTQGSVRSSGDRQAVKNRLINFREFRYLIHEEHC